jgi:hypothetical protein
MDKAELKRFAESMFPGIEVEFVNKKRPEGVVTALAPGEARVVCRHECDWWDEDIKDCFNCNCPLALADKEAARLIGLQIQQIQRMAAENRCNQLTAAVAIATCT